MVETSLNRPSDTMKLFSGDPIADPNQSLSKTTLLYHLSALHDISGVFYCFLVGAWHTHR